MSYFTIREEKEAVIEEKKSEFISSIIRVRNEDEAKNFLEEVKKKHKGARHYCYAYVIGEKMELQRYTDDKEPQGSAGLPILETIKKNNLTDTMIVVTRYFGGVLLGAPLLTRTYGRSASEAVKEVKKVRVVTANIIKFRLDYDLFAKMTRYFQDEKLQIEEIEYNDSVSFKLYTIEDEEKILEGLMDRSNGRIEKISREKDQFFLEEDGKLSIIDSEEN